MSLRAPTCRGVAISAPNNPTEIASGLPPLAMTAREIAEPVPKHKRGIPFLAITKKGVSLINRSDTNEQRSHEIIVDMEEMMRNGP